MVVHTGETAWPAVRRKVATGAAIDKTPYWEKRDGRAGASSGGNRSARTGLPVTPRERHRLRVPAGGRHRLRRRRREPRKRRHQAAEHPIRGGAPASPVSRQAAPRLGWRPFPASDDGLRRRVTRARKSAGGFLPGGDLSGRYPRPSGSSLVTGGVTRIGPTATSRPSTRSRDRARRRRGTRGQTTRTATSGHAPMWRRRAQVFAPFEHRRRNPRGREWRGPGNLRMLGLSLSFKLRFSVPRRHVEGAPTSTRLRRTTSRWCDPACSVRPAGAWRPDGRPAGVRRIRRAGCRVHPPPSAGRYGRPHSVWRPSA